MIRLILNAAFSGLKKLGALYDHWEVKFIVHALILAFVVGILIEAFHWYWASYLMYKGDY